MPLGIGESVGTAYVRIVASGDGLDQSIKDEFDKQQHGFETAGEDAAESWTKAYRKKLKDEFANDDGSPRTMAQWGEHMEKAIADSARNIEFTNAFFDKNPRWKDFKKATIAEFGDIGEQAARNIEAGFRDKGDLTGIADAMENVSAGLARAGKDLIKQQEVIDAERAKLDAETVKRLEAAARNTERLGREQVKAYAEMSRETTRLGREQVKAFEQMSKETDRLSREQVKSFRTMSDETTRLGREQVKAYALMAKEQEKVRRKNEESKNGFEKLGDVMRKTFGGGSRNDFLNFFGGFMAVIPNAISGAIKLSQVLGGFAQKLSAAAKGAEGMGKFTAVLGELLPVLVSAAAGIAVVGVTLMFVASTISLVSAAVVALAGTIGMGLVGAIGVAAGALLPLAAGAGIAFLAIKNFTDEQNKALGQDLKPLTNAWGHLADIASKNIFADLGRDLSSLTPFLKSLGPLMDEGSRAISRQITAWTQLVTSGGLRQFVLVLTRDLPGQIELLGGSIRNFVTIATGLFTGLSPVVTRFLVDFENLTARFSTFVNSASGKKSVTTFFNEAYEAAKKLGGAVLDGVIVLGDLLRAGAKFGGNDLFGDMSDQLKEWHAWLTDPSNQASIEQWVEDGADFARAVGDVVVKIGELIAALDTPLLRTVIIAAVQQMAVTFDLLAIAIGGATQPLSNFSAAANKIDFVKFIGLSPVPQLLGKIGTAATDSSTKTGKAAEDLAKSTNDMAGTQIAAAEKTRELAQAQKDQAAAAKEARDANAKVAAQFVNIKDALGGAKQTLGDFINKLNKQATDLANFTTNIRKAANNGLRDGLIAQLRAAGPAGAAMAAKLANGTKPQIDKVNKAFDRTTEAAERYKNLVIPPKDIDVNTADALLDVHNLDAAIQHMKDKHVTIYVATQTSLNAKRAGIRDATAEGGVFAGAQRRLIGEAGPEAVVPLARPLAMVDPSVRWLSAVAQGKDMVTIQSPQPQAARTVIESGAITVISPASDARAVAWETLNYITAAGY